MQEHIFERMARERNISVEEMRAIISDRIEKGWNEWLNYVVKKIKDDGQEGLLRKYLIW